MPAHRRGYAQAFALCAVAATLLALAPQAIEYAKDGCAIRSPALDLLNTFRVAAIAVGVIAMLLLIASFALRTVTARQLGAAALLMGALDAA